MAKVPPPVPSKPKQINLPYFGPTNQPASDGKPDGSPQQSSAAVASVGNKVKTGQQQRVVVSPGAPSAGQGQALSLAGKQESPPAAAVRPFTPQPSKDTPLPPFRKPQTVAASSIYSMYTQHQAPGKNFQQAVQSALTKTHSRGPHFSTGKLLGPCSTGARCGQVLRQSCRLSTDSNVMCVGGCSCSKGSVELRLLLLPGS